MVEKGPRIRCFRYRKYSKERYRIGCDEHQFSFESRDRFRPREEAALVTRVWYIRVSGGRVVKSVTNVQDQYLGTAGVWTTITSHRKLDL